MKLLLAVTIIYEQFKMTLHNYFDQNEQNQCFIQEHDICLLSDEKSILFPSKISVSKQHTIPVNSHGKMHSNADRVRLKTHLFPAILFYQVFSFYHLQFSDASSCSQTSQKLSTCHCSEFLTISVKKNPADPNPNPS